MKKQITLPSMSQVAAGSKASLQIPLGPTYERFVFVVTAAAGLDASDIGRIDVVINGNAKMTWKNLQRLIDINTYYKREADIVTATRMEFAIHLNRAELIDTLWRQAPGIGTLDLQTLHIELDIPGTAPADIKIKAYAQVNPVRQNIGAFFTIKEFPFAPNTGGDFDISSLPVGPWYAVIHAFNPNVNAVQVQANDVLLVEQPKEVLERFQRGADVKAREPLTAKATHIDFITSGNLLDSLPTEGVKDFRIKLNMGAAGQVDIVTETLDTLQ